MKQKFLRAAAEASPAAFRRELFLDAHSRERFGSIIQPWQEESFRALDAAWLRLAGRQEEAKFQRAYIERPRGHAKTSDMAVQIAWILCFSPRRLSGLAAAADKDQAGLIRDAVQRIAGANPLLCGDLTIQKHAVLNRETGSRLEIIASHVPSSWGVLPDFVICDELCHWEKPDMWYSLSSSAAKKACCVLAVMTNAGVGRGWHWEVREAARRSPAWHFSSLKGARANWLSPSFLAEQRRSLPRPFYERLWENRWQHSDGEFVTLAEAEACRDRRLTKQTRGQPRRRYFAAIDYAEKHDYTVGVILHAEKKRIVVDAMDVAVPRPEKFVKVQWVEDWIRRIAAAFSEVTFILDEYQMLGTLQKLEREYDVRRFKFAGVQGNHALALNLRKLILHREVAWYSGCGAIKGSAVGSAVRDDLETELAALVVKQSPGGTCRIAHTGAGNHDDRSFALGVACLAAVQEMSVEEWLHAAPPTAEGGFNL